MPPPENNIVKIHEPSYSADRLSTRSFFWVLFIMDKVTDPISGFGVHKGGIK